MVEPACPGCQQRDRRIAELERRVAEREATVRDLLARLGQNSANSSIPSSANPLQAPPPPVRMVELIETVVIYKLAHLTREEVQAMLQVHEFRESRLYKDIKEEGVKEGLEKGIAIAIAKMAARKMSVAEIAAILELDEETVQKALAAAK